MRPIHVKPSTLSSLKRMLFGLGLSLLIVVSQAAAVTAQKAPMPENPQSGSVGLEGTISSPPPSRPATITSPSTGRSFSTLPVTVSGLCPEGNLVKLFSNNIFIGSAECKSGSFSLEVDLFNGQNDLIARVYDNLDQAGPDSNTVIVTFANAQLGNFGNRVTLTSNFARKGANPGTPLVWPVILTGGNGPYAMSVDWGDGKPPTLKSVMFPGTIDLDHIYDRAGVYRIIVKATDASGTTAYLQLVGIANGTIAASGTSTTGKEKVITITKTQILLWPSIVAIPLILLTFWIGRRYELLSIRKRIEQSTNDY